MEADDKRKAFNVRTGLTATKITLTLATIVISTIVLVTSAPTLSNFGTKTNRYLFVIGLSAVSMFEMFLPSIVEKIFKIQISPIISLVFIINCFGGTLLGNVANMYHIVPHWDSAMHFLSGISASMLGVALVQFFSQNRDDDASPLYTAVIALFVGIALGTLWEVFEFSGDVLFDLNMQGYALETGELLVGQAALMDTMLDIVLDIAGAIVVVIPTYISLKHGNNWHKCCAITPSYTTEFELAS